MAVGHLLSWQHIQICIVDVKEAKVSLLSIKSTVVSVKYGLFWKVVFRRDVCFSRNQIKMKSKPKISKLQGMISTYIRC